MTFILVFILGCVDHQPPIMEPTPPLVTPTEQARAQTIYSASHILIGYDGARGAISKRTKDAARSRAEDIRIRGASGESFPTLAREYSEGPSSRRGGKLGVVTVKNLSPQFSATLVALKTGEVSLLTETEFGFHIIRRDEVSAINTSVNGLTP